MTRLQTISGSTAEPISALIERHRYASLENSIHRDIKATLSSTPYPTPRRSHLEDALSQVSIQAVAKIAATWTAKGWNPAQSTKNTYRLLEEILEHLKTRGEFADISMVPIEEIALMAIGLSHARSSSNEASSEACPSECIEEVCELLMFSAFTTHSLHEGDGWEYGIDMRFDWLDYVSEQKGYVAKDNVLSQQDTKYFKNGRFLFKRALNVLIPKADSIADRKTRFIDWLQQRSRRLLLLPDNPFEQSIPKGWKFSPQGENELKDLSPTKAHRLVAQWEKKGIPLVVFKYALQTFDEWWIGYLSRTRSQSKKGRRKVKPNIEPTPTIPKAVKKEKAAPEKKKQKRRARPPKITRDIMPYIHELGERAKK